MEQQETHTYVLLNHMQLLLKYDKHIITTKSLMNTISTENQYIEYPVLLHMKQKFVFSSIAALIMCYILIKSYIILV